MPNGTVFGKNGGQPGTWLVIPYYAGDMGARPLPSSIPFWTCSSIKINGSPYAGQPLTADQPFNLTLDAINYGTATTAALCVFYWASPTTAFTGSNVHLLGQAVFAGGLARGALATSQSTSVTLPDGTPQHICLLAEVTSSPDVAPQDYSAATDRHWGQQNIQVVDAASGGQIRVVFTMANGSARAGRYRLEATYLTKRFDSLSHLFPLDTVLHEAEDINFRTLKSRDRNAEVLNAELAAGEILDVELTAVVPSKARPGSAVVLQIAQYEEHRHRPVGGIGVVVRVA
jgi:hypothetical protein